MKQREQDRYQAWLSELDSARFGLRVIRAEHVGALDVHSLLASCQADQADLAMARCAASDLEAVRVLQEAGFEFIDGEVRYEGAVAPSSRAPDRRATIRPAARTDRSTIVELARASFNDYSGHYHADPRLDRSAVRAVYTDWTERCLAGAAAEIVLVVAEPEVRGFAAFRLQGEEAQLVLGCVAAEAAGRGLYTTLTRAGMDWAEANGAKTLFAITQLANTAAQRSWARAGLLPGPGAFTFHRWFS